MRYGRLFYCNPSSFLNDLDPQLVEELDFFDKIDSADSETGSWLEAAGA
jgi:hypothetical protein